MWASCPMVFDHTQGIRIVDGEAVVDDCNPETVDPSIIIKQMFREVLNGAVCLPSGCSAS